MSDGCRGDGSCLIQCCCHCYDCECECNDDCTKEFDDNGEIWGCDGKCCNCKHNDDCEWVNGIHKDCKFLDICLVPTNCQYKCKPQKCINYIICNKKSPQWVLDCHNGCCGANCDIQYGPLTFLEEEDECCICFEDKKMIKLLCNHKFCLDCIIKHCDNSGMSKCPLCRNILYNRVQKKI